MKKIAVFYSEYTPTIDAIKYNLSNCNIVENPQNDTDFDLRVFCNYKNPKSEGLNVHHSLLPAFNCEEPVREAFLAGVKITGITFFYNNSKKIIAQYPVFISNYSHYDEVKKEIKYLEQTIYPIIIKKVLKNEPFDLQELLKEQNCTENCGGCNKCKH